MATLYHHSHSTVQRIERERLFTDLNSPRPSQVEQDLEERMKVIELTTTGSEPLTQTLPLVTDAGEPLTVTTLQAAAAALLVDDKPFTLRYTDSDGDEVTIASDVDVKELADYMADEQLERVAVLVAPQSTSRGAVQSQLRGLVTAMSKLTTGKRKKPTPANAMNLLVASLQTMDVAEDSEELAEIKKQLISVLEDEEFKKAVEELSASEEFKELADVLVTAIYAENAQTIEETATTRFDELLVFAQRVVARCPTLKPVMVNVAKNCMSGLVRFNDEKLADDGSNSSSSSSGDESLEMPVHVNVVCNGCKKAPLLGIRYKSLEVSDFDLCEDCEASGNWVSYEPFIKITDPSRAPKHTRSLELLVHPFVVCDGCEMSPLVGPRFKSKTAEDFDLCEACEASGKWTESHGPFTKIQEPGMMHAMKFTCRRGGKHGHHGKFEHHGHRHRGHHGHHGKFGRQGHHGPPGIPFRGPPPHHDGPDFFDFSPPPHFSPPHHEGRPDFRGRSSPPRHNDSPDFGGRGRPDFHGHHGHGFPPPPPPPDHWRHEVPPGFGPPGCFERFGPPPFGFPGPHGPPPCPPNFVPEFDRRGRHGFRGHHGRHGRQTHFPDDREQQESECSRRRGHGRWGRNVSDLEARFLEDVTIEDGTVVEAGKPLRKMWKLVNDGERYYPDGCYMIAPRGNPFSPEGTELSAINLPALAPGEEFIAEVDLVAPTEPGRYTSFWRVCDPAGVSFGHRFWIDIVVAGSATAETTPSEAPTADSVEDSEMNGALEVAPPTYASEKNDVQEFADAPSDDDIEFIETADAQEAEAVDDAATKNVEDKNKVVEDAFKLLSAMGFTDSDKNLRALELADRNIGGAVNVLLSE